MYCMAFGVSLSNQNKSAQCYEDRASLLCFTACESDLSHLASIEKIFHHKQVQFLLRVVLGILVADPENTQDLGKCSRPLWYKQMVVIYLNSPSQSSIETVVWKRNDAYLLLHGSGDVGKVVRCKVQEGLDLQSGHLLQDEPVIWWETVSKHFRDDQHIIHIITWGEKKNHFSPSKSGLQVIWCHLAHISLKGTTLTSQCFSLQDPTCSASDWLTLIFLP